MKSIAILVSLAFCKPSPVALQFTDNSKLDLSYLDKLDLSAFLIVSFGTISALQIVEISLAIRGSQCKGLTIGISVNIELALCEGKRGKHYKPTSILTVKK